MPSLASIAWCRPSDQRRPNIRRPVILIDDHDLGLAFLIGADDVVLVLHMKTACALSAADGVLHLLKVLQVGNIVDAQRLLRLLPYRLR